MAWEYTGTRGPHPYEVLAALAFGPLKRTHVVERLRQRRVDTFALIRWMIARGDLRDAGDGWLTLPDDKAQFGTTSDAVAALVSEGASESHIVSELGVSVRHTRRLTARNYRCPGIVTKKPAE